MSLSSKKFGKTNLEGSIKFLHTQHPIAVLQHRRTMCDKDHRALTSGLSQAFEQTTLCIGVKG